MERQQYRQLVDHHVGQPRIWKRNRALLGGCEHWPVANRDDHRGRPNVHRESGCRLHVFNLSDDSKCAERRRNGISCGDRAGRVHLVCIEQCRMDWDLESKQRVGQWNRSARRRRQCRDGTAWHSHDCRPDIHGGSDERLHHLAQSDFAINAGGRQPRFVHGEHELVVRMDCRFERGMDQRHGRVER